jgi:hypothetical protein
MGVEHVGRGEPHREAKLRPAVRRPVRLDQERGEEIAALRYPGTSAASAAGGLILGDDPERAALAL